MKKGLGYRLVLLVMLITVLGCNRNRLEPVLSDTIPEIEISREPKIITAFFGLDNALNQRSRMLYSNAPGQDGMPLVFSHEIDPSTLNGSDFEVTTKNGDIFQVEFATLLPANEAYELRTVLLIGEFGNYPDNQPISVKVTDELLSRTGYNYIRDTVSIIPLEEGPILSYAEYFLFDEDYPYVENGRGCDCPRSETKQVVKAVWSGGVTAANGQELGKDELNDFEVSLLQGLDTVKVNPFQLADLEDNDNNIDLCLRESGIPLLLKVKENITIDPRGDKNPKTEITIKSRW
ncbi:MAG: hypothetical protein AAGD17_10460 [Bacteroidota bacterium]